MKAKELKKMYDLSELEIQKVVCLRELLGDDVDGVYSMLKDEDIHISYDDLKSLEVK